MLNVAISRKIALKIVLSSGAIANLKLPSISAVVAEPLLRSRYSFNEATIPWYGEDGSLDTNN